MSLVEENQSASLFKYVLGDDLFDAVETLGEDIHSGAVGEADKVMAGGVKQITATRGVEVKEDAGDDNDLFLETGLEEVEAVGDGIGQTLEVQPAVGS